MNTMSEAQFQTAVIELAQLLGWCVAHFRPARTDQGWRTPVAGDGKGFPDLVLVRPGDRVLFVELKSTSGRLTVDQRRWIDVLEMAGAEVHVWRPHQWDELETILRRRQQQGVPA